MCPGGMCPEGRCPGGIVSSGYMSRGGSVLSPVRFGAKSDNPLTKRLSVENQ